MKRHVHAPQRTVTVEDGTVRDLDGNVLGEVYGGPRGGDWAYTCGVGLGEWTGHYATRDAAVAGLLTDPSCPAGGPNLYDREGTR